MYATEFKKVNWTAITTLLKLVPEKFRNRLQPMNVIRSDLPESKILDILGEAVEAVEEPQVSMENRAGHTTYRRSSLETVKCSHHRHSLLKMKRIGNICDVCRKGENLEYRCQACDFDICTTCFESSKVSTPKSPVVEEGQLSQPAEGDNTNTLSPSPELYYCKNGCAVDEYQCLSCEGFVVGNEPKKASLHASYLHEACKVPHSYNIIKKIIDGFPLCLTVKSDVVTAIKLAIKHEASLKVLRLLLQSDVIKADKSVLKDLIDTAISKKVNDFLVIELVESNMVSESREKVASPNTCVIHSVYFSDVNFKGEEVTSIFKLLWLRYLKDPTRRTITVTSAVFGDALPDDEGKSLWVNYRVRDINGMKVSILCFLCHYSTRGSSKASHRVRFSLSIDHCTVPVISIIFLIIFLNLHLKTCTHFLFPFSCGKGFLKKLALYHSTN